MPRSGSKLSRSKRGKRSGKRSRKRSSKRVNRSSKRTYRAELVDAPQYLEVEHAAKELKIPSDELNKFDSKELNVIESFLRIVKQFDPTFDRHMIDELRQKGMTDKQIIDELKQKGQNMMSFFKQGTEELAKKMETIETRDKETRYEINSA